MTEIIHKEARKASPDPIQEVLRQHKDTWNHEASLLIAQLIAFKRGLNGRGEPKVGLPPGSIKDPIAPEIGSYLDQLADRYNKLISDAHAIIDEQANYSANRNKSQKDQVTASAEEDIIKIASWWGSRAKTYAKNSYVNPWFWFAAKEEVKVRMKLLKISTDFVKKLENLEGFVVSKDNKAIPNAIYDFDKFISAFSQLIFPNVEKLIKIDKVLLSEENKNIEQIPAEVTKTEEKENIVPKENKLEKKQDEKLIEEIPQKNLELSGEESSYALGLSPKEMIDDILFASPIAMIMKKMNPSSKNNFLDESNDLRKKLDQYVLSGKGDIAEIQLAYANLLKLSNSLLNINSQNFSSQLKEVEKSFSKKSENISEEFSKFASNFMSRWLKRQKLKIMSDSEYRIRLVASDKIKNLLQAFDSFQDALENDEQSIDYILKKLEIIIGKIVKLGETLHHLGKGHNDEYEQERLNGKTTTHLIKPETLNKFLKLNEILSKEFSRIKT